MREFIPENTRHALARALIRAGCLRFRGEEPFRLTSGWTTPAYMDCRCLMSYPKVMQELVETAITALSSQGLLKVDLIAGAEASGIALATRMAHALDKPMIFVRKKTRGLSKEGQVVGAFASGQQVLLVDDLMATGFSTQNFCRALHDVGLGVQNAFVVFSYDTFPTETLFSPFNLTVNFILNWHDILSVLPEFEGVSSEAIAELTEFLKAPVEWSHQHHGYPRAL